MVKLWTFSTLTKSAKMDTDPELPLSALLDAWKEGFDAFYNGIPYSENPYGVETKGAGAAWSKGWIAYLDDSLGEPIKWVPIFKDMKR